MFDRIKNGAATINEKSKRNVKNAVENVKKGVESVKKGVNSAFAKMAAPIRRGNERVKDKRKRRKRRQPKGFFPDEFETEKEKTSKFRLARQ